MLAAAAGGSVQIFDLRKSKPTYGKCLFKIGQALRCEGAELRGARGLEGVAPSGKGTLGEWLQGRGANLGNEA